MDELAALRQLQDSATPHLRQNVELVGENGDLMFASARFELLKDLQLRFVVSGWPKIVSLVEAGE